MRRIEGFIDVDKMLKDVNADAEEVSQALTKDDASLADDDFMQILYSAKNYVLFKFDYYDETYYYKCNSYYLPYNELVANELARDFGFPVVEYDLAILGGKRGVISKNFRKEDATYISGEKLLLSCGYNDANNNNLEDIWYALENRYENHSNKREIVEKLMNRVVSLFIFDILICQDDRHSSNWEIEEHGNDIDIAPIYDNESMLSKSGNYAFLSLSIDREHNKLSSNIRKNLELFQQISDKSFTNLIKDKIQIISDENLESVFKRVEDKIGYSMPQRVKDYYLKEFRMHRKQLNKVLKNGELGRDEHYERKNR